MKTLVKTDRNGTKYYEETCRCWKCNGTGIYSWGINLCYSGVCFACEGRGEIVEKTKEYTPEHEAKLIAQRLKRQEQRRAEFEAENAKRIAEQEERERKIAEEKAKSEYIGKVGDKIDMIVTFKFEASFDTLYGEMYIYSFKDEAGNTLVWKTSSLMMMDGLDSNGNNIFVRKGDKIRIKATIKDHNEYRDEKQTIITRAKVLEMVERAEEA